MKKLMPAFERILYHDSTIIIARTARAILRAFLLIIGIAILATVFIGGHAVKLVISNPH